MILSNEVAQHLGGGFGCL